MQKSFAALLAVVTLAACDTPEEQMLRSACQAGDMQACGVMAQVDSQRAASVAAAWANNPNSYYGMQQNSMTCTQLGQFVNCN